MFTQPDFELPVGDVPEGSQRWKQSLRFFEVLLHVAREAWEVERRPSGCMYRALWMMVDAALQERRTWPTKRRHQPLKLLDTLQPNGVEARIAEGARGLLGTNSPHAHLLLEAHETLLGFARRHRLIDETLAAKSAASLAMLKTKLGFPG